MDMSQHPQTDAQAGAVTHHHDQAIRRGEIGAFLLAAVVLAVLATAFVVAGVPGITTVMVTLVPVIYAVLVLISVGR